MTRQKKKCVNCGRSLIRQHGVWLCRSCNSDDLSNTRVFQEDIGTDDHLVIEGPGATLQVPEQQCRRFALGQQDR